MTYTLAPAQNASSDIVAFTRPTAIGGVANAKADAIGANTTWRDFINRVGSSPEFPISAGPPRMVLIRAVSGVSGNSLTSTFLHLSFGEFEPAFATDFWAGGACEVWRVSSGTLSLVRQSAITGSTATQIDLADDGGAAARAGDAIVIRKQFVTLGRNYLVSALQDNRFVAPAVTLAPQTNMSPTWWADDANDPATWQQANGEWFVRYALTLAAVSHRDIELAVFGGSGQSFYPIPGAGVTYRAEIDIQCNASRSAKIVLGSVSDNIVITSINGQSVSATFTNTEYVITLASGRNVFSIEFNFVSTPTDGNPRGLLLRLTQAGQYDLFETRLYDAAGSYDGITPGITNKFSAGNFAFIRDHGIVKTNGEFRAYDLKRLIVSFIHASLSNTVALGIGKFWFQPEFYLHNQAAEMMEYLCGTTGTWAQMRIDMGRTAPWTDDLDFIFEISNETWNFTLGFYQFPQMTDVDDSNRTLFSDEVYGRFFQMFIDRMKAAPNWSAGIAEKFTFAMGGRFNSAYGDIAAQYAPDATIVTRAPYHYTDEYLAQRTDPVTPAALHGVLNHPATVVPLQLADNDTWLATARANGANANLVGGTYEDHFHSAGVPWTDSEMMLSCSKAGATQWLDRLAKQATKYQVQAFFTIGTGAGWFSHIPATGEPYPYHCWTEVWNTHCAGELLTDFRFLTTSRTVTVGGEEYTDVEEVGVYVTKNGSRRAVILVNRNAPYSALDSQDPLYDAGDDGSRSVHILLPWSSGALTRYHMPGAWDAQPWDTQASTYAALSVEAESLGTHTGPLVRTIPAASVEVFVFQNVS